MKVKMIFAFPLIVSTFFGNVVYAQYPSQNQQMLQTDTAPGAHRRNMEAEVNKDVSRIDSVAHLTANQKAQLKQSFAKIERQRFMNNLTTTPNKMDVAALAKKVAKEEEDAAAKTLTPKQLKAWKKAQAANPPNS